jgi:hypothetical protein
VRKAEHHGDPTDDGQRAHPDGQGRRYDRAEDEQEDEKRERQRDEFGADEVVLEHSIEVVHERHFAGACDGEVRRAKPRTHGGVT